jgi:hypothetical protein
MKCAHPMCYRGVGLVSYRDGWYGRNLYCSKKCREGFVALNVQRPPPRTRDATAYFEWLIAQPVKNPDRRRRRRPGLARREITQPPESDAKGEQVNGRVASDRRG